MTAEEIARYNESLLCVPGEAARLWDLTRLRGRDVCWGVSVRCTSLRAQPTATPCPTRAEDRYDDALQLTVVLPNEPMALLGESADGSFCYAETSYYAGWVPAEDIGLCRDLEAWRTAQEGGFLRVTGSRVTLCCDPYEPRVSGAALPMGTRLPLAAPPGTVRALRGRMSYDNYLVCLPVRRADGWLEYREAMVPVSADVCVGDLLYTHENVAAQAAKMRGEVYGWGGMLGGRDCSALVGDVYRCFGFRLPRDAAGLALLPGAEESVIDRIEAGIQRVGPVSGALAGGLDGEGLLRAVLADFELEILETHPVEYKCYCSRERVTRALISMGRQELSALIEEQGQAELTCQFCDKVYRFSREELEELLSNM